MSQKRICFTCGRFKTIPKENEKSLRPSCNNCLIARNSLRFNELTGEPLYGVMYKKVRELASFLENVRILFAHPIYQREFKGSREKFMQNIEDGIIMLAEINWRLQQNGKKD